MSGRRSKPSLASRLRRFWIVGAVALVALAALGRFAVGAPQFRLQRLDVDGNLRVSRAEIVRRAAIDPRANVWLVDARAVEARVETIPFVKTARLIRVLPADARLEITERRADGCIRDRTGIVTVDGDDRVLQRGCSARLVYDLNARAPLVPGTVVHDPDLARLQADARALAASGKRFDELDFDRFGELEGRLIDGIRVRFGDDDDLDAKERLIGPILAALGPRVATVSAIDLRAPGTPVVEHRTAEAPPAVRRASVHRFARLSTPD